MGNTIGILLFEGVEELDAVGPWEVLKAAVEGLEGEKGLGSIQGNSFTG